MLVFQAIFSHVAIVQLFHAHVSFYPPPPHLTFSQLKRVHAYDLVEGCSFQDLRVLFRFLIRLGRGNSLELLRVTM